MLHTVDLVVIIAYLVGMAAFSIYMGGRQSNVRDYFLPPGRPLDEAAR